MSTANMQALDLTTLIPRCHEASKANGWWEPKPNPGQALMLVVSELAEALEADRNGKHADLPAFQVRWVKAERENPNNLASTFKLLFSEDGSIKDTVGDELADAYIRLCDFAGGRELDISEIQTESAIPGPLPENFGEALLGVTTCVVMAAAHPDNEEKAIGIGLATISALCTREGIDLATHIDLKLQYNATRGQKHGGKMY